MKRSCAPMWICIPASFIRCWISRLTSLRRCSPSRASRAGALTAWRRSSPAAACTVRPTSRSPATGSISPWLPEHTGKIRFPPKKGIDKPLPPCYNMRAVRNSGRNISYARVVELRIKKLNQLRMR